jgi:hypothetical protein
VAKAVGRRVLVAALYRGDVRDAQEAAVGGDGHLFDPLQRVERAVDAYVGARTAGLDEPRGHDIVLGRERREQLLRQDAQRGQALVGERYEDPLALLAQDVDLFHARHAQQALAQPLR